MMNRCKASSRERLRRANTHRKQLRAQTEILLALALTLVSLPLLGLLPVGTFRKHNQLGVIG